MSYLTNEKISPLFIESHRLSPFRPRAIDVSVIHDLMIHDIDLLLWLTNSKVTTIDSTGVSVLTDTVDIANVRLTFENGCVANVTASRISAKPMRKMRIFQKNAYFSLDFGKPEIEIFKIDDNNSGGAIPADMLGNLDTGIKNNNIVYFKPDIPQSNAIVAEHDSFCQAINGKGKIAVDAIQAADALRIADIIDNQIKNNMPIN
jgi:predicted dehydrogenase